MTTSLREWSDRSAEFRRSEIIKGMGPEYVLISLDCYGNIIDEFWTHLSDPKDSLITIADYLDICPEVDSYYLCVCTDMGSLVDITDGPHPAETLITKVHHAN